MWKQPASSRFTSWRRLVGVVLILAVAAGWLMLFRPVTLGGSAGYIIVAGGSMEPTYRTGDLAITQRQATYAVGDVIAFSVEGDVVIHRIIGGDVVTGFEVKGDDNALPDLWRPRSESIIGRVWFWLPGFGNALAFIQQPPILAALVAAITFLMVFGGASSRAQPSRSGVKNSPSVNWVGAGR